MACGKGYFGDLNICPDKPCLTFTSPQGCPDIVVETLHISCRSDKFDTDKNFIGFVLYRYKGKSSWTLNNVRCKTGYIFFVESSKLADVQGDTMHARAFFQLFGVELDKDDLVASGFAFREGKWLENSATFNDNATPYTNQKRRDGVTEMKLVKNAILSWTSGGSQNFDTRVSRSKQFGTLTM